MSAILGFSDTSAEAVAQLVELFCWCVALGAWLILLCSLVREAIRRVAKKRSLHLVEIDKTRTG